MYTLQIFSPSQWLIFSFSWKYIFQFFSFFFNTTLNILTFKQVLETLTANVKLWFLVVAAHQNHLGCLKKYILVLGPCLNQLNQSLCELGLGIGVLTGYCDMHPVLNSELNYDPREHVKTQPGVMWKFWYTNQYFKDDLQIQAKINYSKWNW